MKTKSDDDDMSTHGERLKKRREELSQEKYEIQDALKELDGLDDTNNRYLAKFRDDLDGKLEVIERQLKYVTQEIEGPWIDEAGRVNKGAYEGLYIVPLLKALAWSAKDFPTAMRMIGEAVGDKEIVEHDYTMWPHELDKGHPDAYGLLIKRAPECSEWDQVDDIRWDT